MSGTDLDVRLSAFSRALVATLRARFRGTKITLTEIQRIAQAEVDALRVAEFSEWTDAEPVSIEQARRHAMLFRTVRLYGHILDLKDPQLEVQVVSSTTERGDEEHDGSDDESEDDDEATMPSGELVARDADDDEHDAVAANDATVETASSESSRDGEREEVTCVRIRDMHGAQIWSIDIYGDELITKLLDVRQRGLPAEFLGVVVSIPAMPDRKRPDAHLACRREDIVLHLLDVRTSTSTLNLLGASHDERRYVEQLLPTLTVTPLDYLRDGLVKHLGIAGTTDFPLLRDLIELTVLQSVSTGRINSASGRIHILLVGPPAQGKKLVGAAAKILNPICTELSSAKASPAGLVGASFHTANGWSSKPGLIPSAAYGVSWLQDAHGWTNADVQKVAPILQEVIEDGVVRDAVAGGQVREAPTSLVIDANRRSHVTSDAVGAEAPILRIRPLLSRIDVVVEIPPDADRAWRVAAKMYERFRIEQDGSPFESGWVRDARLLVGALRDRHQVIDLALVMPGMRELHEQIYENNRQLFSTFQDAGDIPTRMAISFARLVAASARAHDRDVAEEADLELALKFINMKLTYLQLHGAALSGVSGCPDVQDDRRRWILGAYPPGAIVTAKEVQERYQAQAGVQVSDRTIRRDLEAVGARLVSKDGWKLPDFPGPDMPGKPDTRSTEHASQTVEVGSTATAQTATPATALESDDAGNTNGRERHRRLPLVDEYGRAPEDSFIREKIASGTWTPLVVEPAVSGLARPMTVFTASRKANLIKWAWHGDGQTFCPPIWADLAIGSGACGYACRSCFLMLTHLYKRDPYRPVVYTNLDRFERELRDWLMATQWPVEYEVRKGGAKSKIERLHKRSPKDSIGLGIDCADSLLWEGVTGHARRHIPLFTSPATNPLGNVLVLLTKSANTHYLAEITDRELQRIDGRVPNVAVTMSLNPEGIADLWEGKFPDTLERVTPPISHRLAALGVAQDLGFEVRARIDPILTPEGWEEQYAEFFYEMAHVHRLRPTMLTLGTYREKTPHLDTWRAKWGLPAMEWEPPTESERDGTHFHMPDRVHVYRTVKGIIERAFQGTGHAPRVSLCKETHDVRKQADLCNAACNCLDLDLSDTRAKRRLPTVS